MPTIIVNFKQTQVSPLPLAHGARPQSAPTVAGLIRAPDSCLRLRHAAAITSIATLTSAATNVRPCRLLAQLAPVALHCPTIKARLR